MANVWVIEDNAEQLKAVSSVIAKHGHIVRGFMLAEEVLQALANTVHPEPDLIIVDVALPGELHGFQLAARILQRLHTPPSRFVFLTGWGKESRALQEEPFSQSPLIDKVDWSRTLIPTITEVLSQEVSQ